MEAPDLTIRLARADDAEAILKIYKPYIEDTVITFECEVPDVEEFRKRIAVILKRHPYLVADTEHGIIGYAYASDFKGRSAYDWSVETSIYVDREWQGCGVGTALYKALEKWLKAQNVINLYACITYPNARSIRFHRTFHYRKAAKFKKCGYKMKKWRSIIWMKKTIGKRRRHPQAVLTMDDLKVLMLEHLQKDGKETEIVGKEAEAADKNTESVSKEAESGDKDAESGSKEAESGDKDAESVS